MGQVLSCVIFSSTYQCGAIWSRKLNVQTVLSSAIGIKSSRLPKIQGEREIYTASNQEIDGWCSVCH